jgi:hypothetical protein
LRVSYNVSLSNLVILLAATACLVDAYQTFSVRESGPLLTLALGILLTLWGLQERAQPLLLVLCACALAGLSIADDRHVFDQNSNSYMVLFTVAIIGFLYSISRNRDDRS